MSGEPGQRGRQLEALLPMALQLNRRWEERFGAVPAHPALELDGERLESAWAEFEERLAGTYPFFHPRFAGQMLKPPHPVAAASYVAAMLVNPNNHALDGGPATSEMEREVVGELAAMFHLPAETLGHLTSSGTIANLEALWVARALHPGQAVAYGSEAHYTHARMCSVLGVEAVELPCAPDGRLDLDAAEEACAGGGVGTLVLTAGSTGLGSVDEIDRALELRERHGVRLHVDAAYGGFFALLAWGEGGAAVPAAPLRAIAECDSVVVDPHKHGLQPYGCGAVLFRDPSVGRLYKHDSPYTYFTSDELHLGEISLECSRAGAAAAGLWMTLRALPLAPDDGLGSILAAGLSAARELARLIEGSDELQLHVAPELDIVTYFPRASSLAAVDAAAQAMLAAGGADPDDPVYLSTLRVDAEQFALLHPACEADGDGARVLRSVLMKPEHEHAVPWLFERLRTLAAGH